MPNYCYNIMSVFGEQAEIERLLQIIHGETEFDFEKIRPCPKEISKDEPSETDSEGTLVNRYMDWHVNNWGTKWNAIEPDVQYWEGGYIVDGVEINDMSITFQTAWSPSLPITHTLSTAFPTLYFVHVFEESNMDFSGVFEFENGEVQRNDYGKYGVYR
jgi:hypothetical protein